MRAVILSTVGIVASIVLSAGAQQRPAERTTTRKFGIDVGSGPMDTILLKDYAPASSLVVPETKVAKARFPAIDVHTHGLPSNLRTSEHIAAWLRTMDEVGIETSVVFTGATGAEFDRQVEAFKPFGSRFQLWCALEGGDVGAPDWPERAARELERCYRKGARGIGELTDKGSGMQRGALPRGKRLHPDDPRLDALWRKCAELGIPANVHIADHPSCWQPLGPNQERTPDFQHFNQAGKDVLSYQELIERRDRMLAKHPKTTFIACHLGNQGHDLAALAKALDQHPNLFVDISARDYEVGRQPRAAARFLARYPNRVLFGTDMDRAAGMYRSWWRLLESADEFMPGRIWWRYYGLELQPPVLQSLYRDNARKVLNWERW
jgi:predicted TIM-barrel fold metal-dependent hydrolase